MGNALKDLVGYYADMAQGAGAHDAAAQALQASLAACEAVDPQTLVPELVGVLQKGPLKG